jgi:hypothetical protein
MMTPSLSPTKTPFPRGFVFIIPPSPLFKHKLLLDEYLTFCKFEDLGVNAHLGFLLAVVSLPEQQLLQLPNKRKNTGEETNKGAATAYFKEKYCNLKPETPLKN